MTKNEEKYGKKIEYDPLWRGPMDNIRLPTDQRWLVVFLIYVIIYIFSATYGLIAGDVSKLVNPTDSAGRVCGLDSDVLNKPYLMYLELSDYIVYKELRASRSVCVEQCPTENFYYNLKLLSDNDDIDSPIDAVRDKLICIPEINVTSISSYRQLDVLMYNRKCAKWYLKSRPVHGRCLAVGTWEERENETITSFDLDSTKDVIREDEKFLEKVLHDYSSAVCPACVAILCGGIIALIYVVLLRWFAIPFFYASICMFCIFISFGIYHLSVSYATAQNGSTLFILILLVLLIVLIILACVYFRKKIYLACHLVKESSKAVIQLSSALIFPIIPWMLYICIIFFSATVFLSLLTITVSNYKIEVIGNGDDDGCTCININSNYSDGAICDPVVFNDECKTPTGQLCQYLHCRLDSKVSPCYVYFLHAINIFGFYWIVFFVSGFEYMVLGGTFATWYWTFNKNNVRHTALVSSLTRTIRFHLGSIAVGSLILTISQCIRLIFRGIQHRMQESNSTGMSAFLCCCRYIANVIDSMLSFLSYNAYIMCAVHGKTFVQSAKDAFHLVMRNVLKVVIVNTVIDWLFVMVQLLITCITVTGIMIYYGDVEFEDSGPFAASLILTAIGTYIIVSVIFSVQYVAVNTIFLCFIEDSERNDGTEEKPYYMSEKLKQLLHK